MWQFFKGIKFKQIVVIALALIMFVLAIFISPNYINPEYNDNFGYYNQPDGSVRIFEYLKDYNENEKEIFSEIKNKALFLPTSESSKNAFVVKYSQRKQTERCSRPLH